MTTYFALTTTNAQQNGWSILAEGTDKTTVRAEAEAAIGDIRTEIGTDIYRETQHKNLVVVSKSTAQRSYGIRDSQIETWWMEN